MTIKQYDAASLAKWLPADYATVTSWTEQDLTDALDAGHHAHSIAAEVWEEYANSLPVDAADQTVVQSWKNGEQSETYSKSMSARDSARSRARFHRNRAPIRSVQLKHDLIESEEV